MRVIFSILWTCTILAACHSPEEKAEQVAKTQLKEMYKLDNIETIQVEKNDPKVALPVYLLDILFNGRSYNVSLQVNEKYSIPVDGVVNNRSKTFDYNNYITNKHKILQKESKSYRTLINELEEQGINEYQVYDQYDDGAYRTIFYKMILDDTNIDSKKITNNLYKSAQLLLENLETKVRLQLTTKANNYYINHMATDEVNINIKPYFTNQKKTFNYLLNNQLIAFQTANLVDDEMIEKFYEISDIYNVFIATSSINYISDYHFDPDLRLVRHEMEAEVSEEYRLDDVFTFVKWLKEQGFNHSYIKFHFPHQSSKFCQIQQITTVKELKKCKTNKKGL